MINIGGMNVIVLVFLLSFAIDRVVTGLLFSLALLPKWNRRFPDPRTVDDVGARVRAESVQKLCYVAFAGMLAIILLVLFGNVRILRALNATDVPVVLDVIVTGFVLVGGSDFMGRLLDMSGVYEGQTGASRPVEITGRLILEQSAGKEMVGNDQGTTST